MASVAVPLDVDVPVVAAVVDVVVDDELVVDDGKSGPADVFTMAGSEINADGS